MSRTDVFDKVCANLLILSDSFSIAKFHASANCWSQFLACACRGHCFAPQSKFNARFPALCQSPSETTMGSASNFSRWVEWRKFEKVTAGSPPKVGCGLIEACRGR